MSWMFRSIRRDYASSDKKDEDSLPYMNMHLVAARQLHRRWLLPTLTGLLVVLWLLNRSSETCLPCLSDTPFASRAELSNASKLAKVAKVTMLYGPENPMYERALKTHAQHNENFNYPMKVLRRSLVPSVWSKPAYMHGLLISELEKPEGERLEWLVWMDADILIMNPKIPLEIFLPPEKDFSHVNLVVTDDHRGLNNGVYFLRIHEWSVVFMAAVLAHQHFKPDVALDHRDQTAMMYLLKEPTFRAATIRVEQRWFNAFAGYRTNGITEPPVKYKANSVLEGDLLVHFAGNPKRRTEIMLPWLDVAEARLPTWELDLEQTTYNQEIAKFWAAERKHIATDRLKAKIT